MSGFYYRWESNKDGLPDDAFRAGTDVDGQAIYVGNAYHENDFLPAKIIPSKNECYVCYDGKEIRKDEYQILCTGVSDLAWIHSRDGQIPGNAISAGWTADGETLYIGRVLGDGHITPGKVQPSHGALYYPFNGEEKKATEYEILITRN